MSARDLLLQNLGRVARCTPIPMQHATRDSVHNASRGVRAIGTATAVQQPAAVRGKAQAQRATAHATGVQQRFDQAGDLRRQLYTAQRTGAISRDDLAVALEAIERNRDDPQYLLELRLLVLWCHKAHQRDLVH